MSHSKKVRMKIILPWLLFLTILSCASLAQGQSPTAEAAPTFREPFTLKLRVDKQHYYEQHFDKVPYVAGNDVYLFVDNHFGVNLTDTKAEFLTVTYQPDGGKADILFSFTQETEGKGTPFMMLSVQNKLNRGFSYDALMTVPTKKEILETHVLPVEARLSNFEFWPHPIVQLVLRNFRFSDSPAKSRGATPK
jgi:hypothetical protein